VFIARCARRGVEVQQSGCYWEPRNASDGSATNDAEDRPERGLVQRPASACRDCIKEGEPFRHRALVARKAYLKPRYWGRGV
jgi:hypothetical protein